jgi:hypothetical protein
MTVTVTVTVTVRIAPVRESIRVKQRRRMLLKSSRRELGRWWPRDHGMGRDRAGGRVQRAP